MRKPEAGPPRCSGFDSDEIMAGVFTTGPGTKENRSDSWLNGAHVFAKEVASQSLSRF